MRHARPPDLHKCIYCLVEKTTADFNEDHIFPRGFGIFKGSAGELTLAHTVCTACNQFYGDTIERILARESFEGMLRGTIDPEKASKFKAKDNPYLRMKSEEGRTSGHILEPVPIIDGGKIGVREAVQVGFWKTAREEWVYFVPAEIPMLAALDQLGYDIKKGFSYSVATRDEEEAVFSKMRDKGYDPSRQELLEVDGPRKGDSVIVVTDVTVGRPILRAIGKIAFNFMAHHYGTSIANGAAFNRTRQYIRHGEFSGKLIVTPSQSVPQVGFPITDKMHFITLENVRSGAVFSHVGIHGQRYRVTLADDYRGPVLLWKTHIFDIATERSYALG